MSAIEALYIYDEHNTLIFDHVYTGRPPASSTLLNLYLQQPSPRPSVIYLTSTSPPTILFSVIQDNILFLSPSSSDVEPLLVLEFLHRFADALEEFVGSPLLTTKITSNYDIVAQIAAEMADGGIICQGEANALRDVVETGPGVLNNLLGKVGISGSTPVSQGLGSNGLQRLSSTTPAQSSQGSAIPWRRSNVRHTSNELYVDIIESLSVTLAPSGRPLSAFAHGSIAFTSKVSGVPDLLLTLNTGGKGGGMGHRGDQLRAVMERAVFHPCVRLSTWKKDGVLSFVPPDGRFALCGYETDLLGPDVDLSTGRGQKTNLNLPVDVEVNSGLGSAGTEFEVRVKPNSSATGVRSAATASLQSNLGPARPGSYRPAPSGDSKSPSLEDLTVHVPIPQAVRNVSELRPTKGEAHWSPAEGTVEWKIPSKEFGPGAAVLRCTVQGPLTDDDVDVSTGVVNGISTSTYDYDEEGAAYQSEQEPASHTDGGVSKRKLRQTGDLMPTSVALSFSVKGWLSSGLKVESLLLDNKKSRGIGAEVKPYKGVKYLTVSRQGVEIRC